MDKGYLALINLILKAVGAIATLQKSPEFHPPEGCSLPSAPTKFDSKAILSSITHHPTLGFCSGV